MPLLFPELSYLSNETGLSNWYNGIFIAKIKEETILLFVTVPEFDLHAICRIRNVVKNGLVVDFEILYSRFLFCKIPPINLV